MEQAMWDPEKKALQRVRQSFPSVAMLIDWGSEHEKAILMPTTQTGYSMTMAITAGDMEQTARSEKELNSLKR